MVQLLWQPKWLLCSGHCAMPICILASIWKDIDATQLTGASFTENMKE
jgi:hypothetical protein